MALWTDPKKEELLHTSLRKIIAEAGGCSIRMLGHHSGLVSCPRVRPRLVSLFVVRSERGGEAVQVPCSRHRPPTTVGYGVLQEAGPR